MEIVALDPSVRVRGERAVVVAHGATGLTRGLEQREAVVLHTVDGDYFAAQVSGIDFDIEDTFYTFDIGARLPEDLALERVQGLDPDAHDLGLHEIVDLLGEISHDEEG